MKDKIYWEKPPYLKGLRKQRGKKEKGNNNREGDQSVLPQ